MALHNAIKTEPATIEMVSSAATRIPRPPGPDNQFPWLGVLPRFRKDPPKYLLELARKYGDLVHLRLANQHAYIVSHPDAVRDVLVTNQNNFKKSRILERARVLLGQGLLTSEGEFHTRQRRLVQPAFHRDRLIHYADDMVACAVRAREQLQPGEQDIWHVMTHLTLAIVGRTLFSADISSDANHIGGALTEIFSLFDTLLMPFSEWLMKLPLPAMRKFERARDQLDRVVYGLIADRRASGKDTGDLLSMLLLAQDTDGDSGGDGSGMSDKQVRDEALTLLLAGHETTANALSWCWYLLGQNPEVEARFHSEIDSVLAGMKRFRGTALDVFGRSAERRQERQLIRDYAVLMDEVLASLAPHNHALAVELASIPEHIRGFGHVKERHLKAAKAKEATLLDAFRAAKPTIAIVASKAAA